MHLVLRSNSSLSLQHSPTSTLLLKLFPLPGKPSSGLCEFRSIPRLAWDGTLLPHLQCHCLSPRLPSRPEGTPQSPSSSLPLCCSATCPYFTDPGVRVLAPDSGLTRQVNDEPAIHFILLGDEGSGAVRVLSGLGVAEEKASEALEHGGEVKRPQGAPDGSAETWEV